MKLKNILIPFLALASMVACVPEDPIASSFSEISIEPSYIGFKAEGGSIKAEVNAEADWKFDEATLEAAKWLTVEPKTGAAGKTEVTFRVNKNEGGDKYAAELKIVSGNRTQFVNVSQASGAGDKLVITSIKDVLAAEVGKTFNVEGVVSNITNTDYGNLDITDATGTIYIYGFLDKSGNTKNFKSLGIEDGDRIIISGPRDEYHGNPQMKNVSLVQIVKKSLIKIEQTEFDCPHIDTTLNVRAEFKNDDISVDPTADWVKFKGISKDGDKTIIILDVAANTTLAPRKCNVIVKSGEDSKTIKVAQEPRPATPEDIIDASVKDVLEANTGKGGPFYRVSGMIKKIAMDKDHKDKQDAKGKFTIVDGSGEIYVYGLTATDLIGKDSDFSFPSLNLKNGDFVTIVGARDEYKGNPQLTGPAYYVRHDSAEKKSVKDFLNGEIGDRAHRAILTGTVTNIKPGDYGNFDLIDENGDKVYVYGLVNGPSYYEKEGQLKFSNNKSFPTLGINEGATISIISVLGEYGGKKQAIESYLNPDFKVIPGEEVKPDPEKPVEGTFVKLTSAPADWSGSYVIVFGENAHATLDGKDLKATVEGVKISNDKIASADVKSAVITVEKLGDKYSVKLPDGQYLGMAKNACAQKSEPYALSFSYTEKGVKITDGTYILYSNQNKYFRCYVEKDEASYVLPTLYKLSK